MKDNEHYSILKESYAKVGSKTWKFKDFLEGNVSVSRAYYTNESLQLRKPIPKNLEVYTLLSGLPFSEKMTESLLLIQEKITKILESSLYYWVKTNNFGVEYCVFKWPDDDFDMTRLQLIKEEISKINLNSFKFSIRGIQVNPDGCIVAKGYDENRTIFTIRNRLKNKLNFMPLKQSGWAHIPIGRILEPIGTEKFIQLKKLIEELDENFVIVDRISTFKLIHETQWYMEKKTTLVEYNLK
jgi:hypothetical protein